MGDESHWTERAAAGDREALGHLIELHLPELRAFVRLRAGPELRSQESASDLAQSVCRATLEAADRFRHPGDDAFRRFLFTTARRVIADRAKHLRTRAREAAREPGAEDRLAEIARVYSRITPSAIAERREELERFEAAFDRLDPEQRDVVAMAHFAGLDRAAIGAELGKSEGAVRVQLHRALARLARLLEESDRSAPE